MDNFLKKDENTFIHDKSIEIFKILNNVEFDSEEVKIEKEPLSGISNTIYKVSIEFLQKECPLTIHRIFFKIFGRISVLVDRPLETFIMQQLYELGIGPKIIDTDMKTYRIEEFLDNCVVMEREMMLSDAVYPKVIKNFSSLNAFGDFKFYFDYVGEEHKSLYFDKLKNDNKTNFINFTLKKMKPLGITSFLSFKEKYIKNDNKNFEIFDEKRFSKIEYILENFDKILYDCCPDQVIIVINHNDAHPLNILHTPKYNKIILCDFEYSSYNILGFDIANYLNESLFLLQADNFPFYQYITKGKNVEYSEDKYFEIYLSFFDNFEKDNFDKFKDFKDFEGIINKCKTKDYYYRLIGLSSLFWFIFAVIYFDFDSINTKSGYDYFNYAYDKVNIFDEFVRSQIHL